MQVTASHGRTDPCSLCGGMLRLWNVPPGFHLLHPFALIQAVGILKEKDHSSQCQQQTVFPSEGWQWAVRACLCQRVPAHLSSWHHDDVMAVVVAVFVALVLSSLPLFSPHHFDPSSRAVRAVEQSSSRLSPHP